MRSRRPTSDRGEILDSVREENPSRVASYYSGSCTEIESSVARYLESCLEFDHPIAEVLTLTRRETRFIPFYLVQISIFQDFYTSTRRLIHRISDNAIFYLSATNKLSLDEARRTYYAGSELFDLDSIKEQVERDDSIILPIVKKVPVRINDIDIIDFTYDYAIKRYTKTIHYTGRNNHQYSKVCVPNKKNINVRSANLAFVPETTISYEILGKTRQLTLSEKRDSDILVLDPKAFECEYCHGEIAGKGSLCSECGRIVHGRRLLMSHSFKCSTCGKILCKDCARFKKRFLFFKKFICTQCSHAFRDRDVYRFPIRQENKPEKMTSSTPQPLVKPERPLTTRQPISRPPTASSITAAYVQRGEREHTLPKAEQPFRKPRDDVRTAAVQFDITKARVHDVPFCIVDLETTGFSPRSDEILQIGVIKMVNFSQQGQFTTLIKPRQSIPEHITRINGITNKMVRDKPNIEDVKADFIYFVENTIIVEHSSNDFDYNFLQQHLRPTVAIYHMNTHKIARKLYPGWKSYKLDTLARNLGIDTGGLARHDACGDAQITTMCFTVLLKELIRRGYRSVNDLLESGMIVQKKPCSQQRGV